jgi:hypothetical protein
MTTWTPINTNSASAVSYDFNPFATLSFGEGAFADGLTYEPWGNIGTSQSPNWGAITTTTPVAYDYAPFAHLSFGEGAFADGWVYDPWALISTS